MKNLRTYTIIAGLAAFIILGGVAHAQDTNPPTIPSNVSAYVTQSGQVYVSWTGSTDDIGVNGYYVYRDGQIVANTPGLLFFTDNAPPGSHVYAISAYDAAGNVSSQSGPSSVVIVPSDTVPPSIPTDFSLTPSSSSVTLSWTNSTDNVAVIGYYIYRNGRQVTTQQLISGSPYTDTGLTPGYQYTYQVGAYDAAGNISRTNSLYTTTIFDVTPPAPPQNLRANVIGPNEIDLTWSPATDNIQVVNYLVYQNGSFLGTGFGTSTQFSDYSVSPNTVYSYQVVSVDEVGNVSAFSIPAAGTTPAPDTTPPSIPGNMQYISPSTSEVDLVWGPSADNVRVTGYYVFRDSIQIGSTASTTYSDTNLSTSTTYLYAVKAYDAAGNISSQQSIAATTLTQNPINLPPVQPPPPINQPPPVGGTGGTGTGTNYVFTVTLSIGMRGVAVTALQNLLIAHNYLAPGYNTGYFGNLTQRAVQAFQCANNIVCSGTPYSTGYGLVGARTRRALNAVTY